MLDGSGKPAVKADVLLKRDKIVALGSFPQYKADEIIDGMGAYLSPGFIDTNNNADLYLNIFTNPSLDEFLKQGITTIIGGQNGISLAPLIYGSLELHKFFINAAKTNINWHSFREFLETLDKKPLGVNFGSLAGHSTIREAIIGDDFRDSVIKEMEVIKFVLEKSLQEGAYGVSFDLSFPLTTLTPNKELKYLLEIIEKYKAVATFRIRAGSDASVLLKNEKGNLLPAVNEIINLAQETGTRIYLNNFSCPKGLEDEYKEALDAISDSSASADVSFNFNFAFDSLIPIFAFLPPWAQRGSLENIKANLNDAEFIVKVKKDFPIFKTEEIGIFSAPGFEYLTGKTVNEFALARGLNKKDAILELMKLTKLRAVLSYKNVSVKTLSSALLSDRASVASAEAGFPYDYPGNKITEKNSGFLQLLKIATKEKNLALEIVIKKITSFAARQIGIKDRGLIRENYYADLVLFRDGRVETVIVNGKVAWRDEKRTGVLSGKVLKRSA